MVTKTKSILVVDDSPIIIERLSSLLEAEDDISQITTANSFTEAASLIDKTHFDIAILDINLPGKSGIQLLQHIMHNHATIKVIMLTNQNNEYYRKLCLLLGASFYIDKSTEFEQIFSIIQSL